MDVKTDACVNKWIFVDTTETNLDISAI